MKIEEYIASGILESYVLGELSAAETEEIEDQLRRYPELREELVRIELGMEALAMSSSIEPSEKVKNRLYDTLQFEEPSEEIKEYKGKEIQVTLWRRVAAVAAVFFFVAAILATNYYTKWQNAESELTAYIVQNELQTAEMNKARFQLDSMQSKLAIALNPEFEKIQLAGTPNAPDSRSFVYWNEKTAEVYLQQISMMDLPEDRVFQLWAIIDGQPQDAGVFTAESIGLVKMKDITGANAFAVTIEPAGGSLNPTLETMQIIGEVPA